MNTHEEINKIYLLLQSYDAGQMTADECIVRIEDNLMQGKIERLRLGEWVANWSFGCARGEANYTYALMEHNDWELWYYPFTFRNLVRFYWNQAVRRLGWLRLVKVG